MLGERKLWTGYGIAPNGCVLQAMPYTPSNTEVCKEKQ